MDNVLLYDELKLIERDDAEINNAWKGVHLLLFFMAFVFGSFCTFSFHMLMYLFDKKCVLYPKLLWLTSLPHDIIYEFIPVDKEIVKMLPVDFVSTQWMEKSVCYLPTYVPLMSGIFGIIWTTMFLVCYTGTGTLEGSRRSWRVLLPIFLFSVAMSGLCIYSSTITHQGLEELCVKLGEITGSSTCTYTVNVATLAYERSIRGVYQAIQLTITSAWLHTSCWVMSAVLIMVRVVLLVDFQLVRIKVELKGDIDRMLQQYEEQMRTVSPNPNVWPDNKMSETKSDPGPPEPSPKTDLPESEKSEDFRYHYKNTDFSEGTVSTGEDYENFRILTSSSEDETPMHVVENDPTHIVYIRDLLNDLISSIIEVLQLHIEFADESDSDVLTRNFYFKGPFDTFMRRQSIEIAKRLNKRRSSLITQERKKKKLHKIKPEYKTLRVQQHPLNKEDLPSTSTGQYEEELADKKSNLKNASTQSDFKTKSKSGAKVQILEDAIVLTESESKSTQTPEKKKEE